MVRVLPLIFPPPPPLSEPPPHAETPTASAAIVKTAAIRVARKSLPLLLKGIPPRARSNSHLIGGEIYPVARSEADPARVRSHNLHGSVRGGERLPAYARPPDRVRR